MNRLPVARQTTAQIRAPAHHAIAHAHPPNKMHTKLNQFVRRITCHKYQASAASSTTSATAPPAASTSLSPARRYAGAQCHDRRVPALRDEPEWRLLQSDALRRDANAGPLELAAACLSNSTHRIMHTSDFKEDIKWQDFSMII